MFIDNLHFQIDNGVIIHDDFNIKNKIFGVYFFAQFYRISDLDGSNICWGEVKKCTDQSLKDVVVPLQKSTEQIVVGHGNGNRSL